MITNQSANCPVINRTAIFINPDRKRVLIRPFAPGTEQRILKIIARLLALSEAEIDELLTQALTEFSGRHQKTKQLFMARFEFVRPHLVQARDRLVFYSRILTGGGRTLQSIHCRASRPVGITGRIDPFCAQLARHRRRSHLLHHLPHRRGRCRQCHHHHHPDSFCHGATTGAGRTLLQVTVPPSTGRAGIRRGIHPPHPGSTARDIHLGRLGGRHRVRSKPIGQW